MSESAHPVYIAVAGGGHIVATGNRRREIEQAAGAVARNLGETLSIKRLEPAYEDSYGDTGLLVGPDGDIYRPRGKQETPEYVEPFDVQADWDERA